MNCLWRDEKNNNNSATKYMQMQQDEEHTTYTTGHGTFELSRGLRQVRERERGKKHLCYRGNRKIVKGNWENVLHKAASDRSDGEHKQSVRKAGSGNKHGISKFAGVK